MTIKHLSLLLFLVLCTCALGQADVGYLNGAYINAGGGDEAFQDSNAHEKHQKTYARSDLRPAIRLRNTTLGYRLFKKKKRNTTLIPLVNLGLQYNNTLEHRNGLGFLLETHPIKNGYVRIGGLFDVSNSAVLNPGSIRLSNIGSPQQLWFMPMTRVAYTPNEVFSFHLGYDKNFIGAGRRSLFTSDYGKPMPFGQIRAQFWHMEYSVNYQFLSEDYQGQPHAKFLTSHYLSWDILPWLNFGVFEAVVFQPKDTLLNRGCDVEYMNPFVFYRPQEYSLGSSDNIVIGAALKASIQNTTIYSQIVLDEFLLSEIRSRSGWWANKFGLQLGVKGRLTDNLNYRLEGNLVRPYTFSHLTPMQVYGHRGSALAHPYGSNFVEVLTELNWRKKMNAKLRLKFFASIGFLGKDIAGLNYGADIYESYINRPNDYGNFIGQGLKQTFFITNTRVSYPVLKEGRIHAFAELQTQYSKSDNFSDLKFIPMVGLRSYLWNDYRNY